MKKVDAVVIGGGPGGYVAAIRLGQYGKKVALIEKTSLGGVCLNVGCIPSKAMIYASGLFSKIKEAETFGIETTGVKVHAKKLQEWKTGVVRQLTAGVAQLLKANQVEFIRGEAFFTGKQEVRVTQGQTAETVVFDSAIIATGSRPIEISGFLFDGRRVISSTEALAFDAIPETLCVVGGGYIGLEIGSLYAGFGTKVIVVEATDQLLPGNDPDLVQVVARELKRRDVKILLKTTAKSWKETKGKTEVVVTREEKEETLAADKILVAVGRTPNAKNLGLEALGIQKNSKGFIQVNDQLKTNVEGFYAIGDVAGPPLLAHKASKEGLIAAGVIAGKRVIYDVRAMPAVVFTTPEIATVGLTETEAKSKGKKYKVGKFHFAASGKALATAETDGFVKILADAENDRILGVGMVGHDVSSLIGEAALAIEMGARTEDVALTVHPHPTLTEAFMEAAEAVHERAIHIVKR